MEKAGFSKSPNRFPLLWGLGLLAAFGLGAAAYMAARFLWVTGRLEKGRHVLVRERAYPPKGRKAAGSLEVRVGPGSPDWTGLEQVSGYLRDAVISAEDDGFYEHEGFDFEAMRHAAAENLKSGRVVRGGSTITQQLAKNLFLSPSRSYIRKLQEAAFAAFLERRYTKDELLERYINVVEWGPEVYGIKAAARYYFGAKPSALGLKQSVFLAVLLPSPKRYSVWARKGPSEYAQRRMDVVLDLMRRHRVITPEEEQAARAAPLGFAGEARTAAPPLLTAPAPAPEAKAEEKPKKKAARKDAAKPARKAPGKAAAKTKTKKAGAKGPAKPSRKKTGGKIVRPAAPKEKEKKKSPLSVPEPAAPAASSPPVASPASAPPAEEPNVPAPAAEDVPAAKLESP